MRFGSVFESWEVKVKTLWRWGENLRSTGVIFKGSGRGFGASALRSYLNCSSLKAIRGIGIMMSSSGLFKGTVFLSLFQIRTSTNWTYFEG